MPRMVEPPATALPPPSDANLLFGGERPVPPPIVAPPREPPLAPRIALAEEVGDAPHAPDFEDSLHDISQRPQRGRARLMRTARGARWPAWLSAAALTILILGAVALAVIAIAR